MKNIFPFIVFVSISFFFTSCFSYKEIELGDVENVRLNKVSGGGLEIKSDMLINNPNNYKIKIKKIEADVLVNGKKVGKIELNKKIVLPKKSEQMQTFTVNTQLSDLLSAAPTVLFGGPVLLQLKGYIKGKVFIFSKKFPLDEERTISPKDLNIF
jgi:LEA14-like dessication related protein